MGKRALRRIDQFASRELTTILIIGARPEDALGRILRKAFDGARFFPDLATLDIKTADLAIGVFEGSDNHKLQAFAKWGACAVNMPALCAELRENEALIGPLALPGNKCRGCGCCAF